MVKTDQYQSIDLNLLIVLAYNELQLLFFFFTSILKYITIYPTK